MKRIGSAARLRQAQLELAKAESELAKSARPWRRHLQRHRNMLTLLGGFASGLALTLLPPRWWARVGAALGATASSLARSALTPAVVGAVIAQIRHVEDKAPQADEPSTPASAPT